MEGQVHSAASGTPLPAREVSLARALKPETTRVSLAAIAGRNGSPWHRQVSSRGGAEYGLLPGVATPLAVLVIALYVFMCRRDRTKQGYGAVLSGVTLSQMATLLQQSRVIAQLSMDRQEFMASTLQCRRQFAFDFEALNLNCAAEVISTMHYILRNLLSVGFIVFCA